MNRRRLARISVVAGLAATVAALVWVQLAGGPDALVQIRGADPVLVAGIVAITAFCVGVRFLRWQFLLRRLDIRIPIRASLSMYLASLAGIATPAYVGEAVRVVFLYRRFDVPYRRALTALAFERLLDFFAVALIAFAFADGWALRGLSIAVVVLCAVLAIGLGALAKSLGVPEETLQALRKPGNLVPALVLSTIAWMGAGMVVAASASAFDISIPGFDSMRIFASSTLIGGLSLMPAGTIFTGGSAIVQLQASGLPVPDSVTIVSLMRAGTVGITFLVSGVFLVFELLRLRRAPAVQHFDQISSEYADQFNEHVWNHLIARKLDLMEGALGGDAGRAGRGLDLGCGLGLQAGEMARRGYDIVGMDLSTELLHLARNGGLTVVGASALELPFPDQSFDFVYSIGVLHHLPSPAAQDVALREVVRVLKPGGHLLVHESNPRNPLFRFYMGYVFPILRSIDEGTEHWIHPRKWPEVEGLEVESITYFTFLPDFIPSAVMGLFVRLEKRLERSRRVRRYSVHYQAALRKPA